MKVNSGKRGKKGFTMLEVMLVVAILSIILAIAVPGVVRLSRDLKMTKLDDIAREIYTSAQSQAVSLSVSGQLSQVECAPAKLYSDGAVPVAEGVPPVDPPAESVVQCVYSSTSDAEKLLPLGSVEEVVRQNHYIIEYNPVTAAIKGVYYWEDVNDYNFATDGDEGYGSLNPEDRDKRMNYRGGMVGYYGGPDIGRLTPPAGGVSSVSAELVNDEELYLDIKQGFDSGTPLTGKITVTLTDVDKNVSRKIEFNNQDCAGNDGNLSYESADADGNPISPYYRLTLDSLKSGLRFSELYPEGDDGSFHPGCELKVTVTFQENGKQPWSKDFHTNSLFASVSGKFGTERTAYIACGRHLENLGVRFVYPGEVSGVKSDPLNGVTKAVQTKNIDWKKSVAKVGGAPALFTPIVNYEALDDKYLKEYDGRGNTISHLKISDDISGITDGIGLFSQFMGEKIENVNLVNCTLTETGSLPAGLLAGSVEPVGTCTISNCHAYAVKEDDSFNCSINASSGTPVGGLIGSVQGANIEKCSASLTKIAGGTSVGGLAGQATGSVTITQCYADTGLWRDEESGLSGGTVGGLLGSIGGPVKLTDSYAVGWARNSTNVFGLVGAKSGSDGVEIKSCYAAVLNGGDPAELVPSGLQSAAEAGGCIGYGGNFGSLLGTESAFVSATEKTTNAYKMPSPPAPVYPFPRLKEIFHYGDWPEATAGRMTVAYYEVYEKDEGYSIGFYGKAKVEDKVLPIDTLKDDEDFAVVMDGYAVMLPPTYAGESRTVKYNGADINETSALKLEDALLDASERFGSMSVEGFNSETGNVAVEGVEYHPLFLSSAMMMEENNTYAETSYYQKLEFQAGGFEVNVWFNPYVAKSDFVPVDETPETLETPAVSILRSSRQVAAYSCDAMQSTAVGDGEKPHTLKLERNIDCSTANEIDSTVSVLKCLDLKISGTDPANTNVILELNGKTLTGTGTGSVVSSNGGKLEIYGQTKEKPHEGTAGTIKGSSGDSVNAVGEVTIVGCTIIDNPDVGDEADKEVVS